MNQSMAIHLDELTVGGLYRSAQAMTKAGAPNDAIVTLRHLRDGSYDLEAQWGAEDEDGRADARKDEKKASPE